jgi:hypothetical protein
MTILLVFPLKYETEREKERERGPVVEKLTPWNLATRNWNLQLLLSEKSSSRPHGKSILFWIKEKRKKEDRIYIHKKFAWVVKDCANVYGTLTAEIGVRFPDREKQGNP